MYLIQKKKMYFNIGFQGIEVMSEFFRKTQLSNFDIHVNAI